MQNEGEEFHKEKSNFLINLKENISPSKQLSNMNSCEKLHLCFTTVMAYLEMLNTLISGMIILLWPETCSGLSAKLIVTLSDFGLCVYNYI